MASDTKKRPSVLDVDRIFMLILIPKSASNFTPTVLNRRRKISTVNHLFSGSQGPYSHVYLQLHVMYTVPNHIHIHNLWCSAGDACDGIP